MKTKKSTFGYNRFFCHFELKKSFFKIGIRNNGHPDADDEIKKFFDNDEVEEGGKGGWFDFNYELTHLRFVQTPTQVRPEQADFFLPNVSIIFTIVSLFLSLSLIPPLPPFRDA